MDILIELRLKVAGNNDSVNQDPKNFEIFVGAMNVNNDAQCMPSIDQYVYIQNNNNKNPTYDYITWLDTNITWLDTNTNKYLQQDPQEDQKNLKKFLKFTRQKKCAEYVCFIKSHNNDAIDKYFICKLENSNKDDELSNDNNKIQFIDSKDIKKQTLQISESPIFIDNTLLTHYIKNLSYSKIIPISELINDDILSNIYKCINIQKQETFLALWEQGAQNINLQNINFRTFTDLVQQPPNKQNKKSSANIKLSTIMQDKKYNFFPMHILKPLKGNDNNFNNILLYDSNYYAIDQIKYFVSEIDIKNNKLLIYFLKTTSDLLEVNPKPDSQIPIDSKLDQKFLILNSSSDKSMAPSISLWNLQKIKQNNSQQWSCTLCTEELQIIKTQFEKKTCQGLQQIMSKNQNQDNIITIPQSTSEDTTITINNNKNNQQAITITISSEAVGAIQACVNNNNADAKAKIARNPNNKDLLEFLNHENFIHIFKAINDQLASKVQNQSNPLQQKDQSSENDNMIFNASGFQIKLSACQGLQQIMSKNQNQDNIITIPQSNIRGYNYYH